MTEQIPKEGIRTVLLQSPDEVNLDVHQVMPSLTKEEFAALKEDIRENGILYPIFLDENYNIIDGHNRVLCWKHLLLEKVDPAPVAAHVFPEMDKYKAHDLAIAVNVKRRHLGPEQKRELIRNQLRHLADMYEAQGHTGENTRSWDNARIARYLASSRDTVRDTRRKMEKAKQIPTATFFVYEKTSPQGKKYEAVTSRKRDNERVLVLTGREEGQEGASSRLISREESQGQVELSDGTKIGLPDVEQIVKHYQNQASQAVEEARQDREQEIEAPESSNGNGSIEKPRGAVELLRDAGIEVPDPPKGPTPEEKTYQRIAAFRSAMKSNPSDPKAVVQSIADRPLQVAATAHDFGELVRWLSEFHAELVRVHEEQKGKAHVS
jgi:hypothetical protein